MNKNEHDAVVALLDGIENQLKAVKALITPEAVTPPECSHQNLNTISTMGGVQGAFCLDCGAEFVMGVLEEPENNE